MEETKVVSSDADQEPGVDETPEGEAKFSIEGLFQESQTSFAGFKEADLKEGGQFLDEMRHLIQDFKVHQLGVLNTVTHQQVSNQKMVEDAVCRGLQGVAKSKADVERNIMLRHIRADLDQAFQEQRLQLKVEWMALVDELKMDFQAHRDNAAAIFQVVREDMEITRAAVDSLRTSSEGTVASVKGLLSSLKDLTGVVAGLEKGSPTQVVEEVHQMVSGLGEAVDAGNEVVMGMVKASMEKMQLEVQEAVGTIAQNISAWIEDMKQMQPPALGVEVPLASSTPHPCQPEGTATAREPSADIRKPSTPCKKSSSRKKRTKKGREAPSYSESSSSGDSSSELDSDSDSDSDREVRPSKRDGKVPPFTGKEKWAVWFTRFETIAKRKGWSKSKRLDMMLPKLQGQAGEFVYDQLSSKVRDSYKLLVRELQNRFRKIENPKTYSVVFSNRNQKATEEVEDFAAELKRLYDKAHPDRDEATRREDLLRRFFDGLSDGKARFHVEFVKDPKTIDQAVDEVVNFLEVSRKQGKTARRLELDCFSDAEDERAARAPGRPPKAAQQDQDQAKTNPQAQPLKEPVKQETSPQDEVQKALAALLKEVADIKKRQEQQRVSNNQPKRPGGQAGSPFQKGGPKTEGRDQQAPQQRGNGQAPQQGRQSGFVPICFRCGQQGHMYRDCSVMAGGVQMFSSGFQPLGMPHGHKPVGGWVPAPTAPPPPSTPAESEESSKAAVGGGSQALN